MKKRIYFTVVLITTILYTGGCQTLLSRGTTNESEAAGETEVAGETETPEVISETPSPITEEISYLGEGFPRHAPNVFIDFASNQSFDIITIDWYCIEDGVNTYYAVHNWDGGYAGFMNSDGEHKILFSVWDGAMGVNPTIEYVLDGDSGDFGNEGTGKQIYTNFEWQEGHNYTMRMQTWEADGKTYIGQWVCEVGGEWTKTAVMSLPTTGFAFTYDSMFMEDFTFNNVPRACAVSNSYGRVKGTQTWISNREWTVSNDYYPTDPPTNENVEWNIDFDATWGLSDERTYVAVSSGGSDFTPTGCEACPIVYTVTQEDTPNTVEFIQP